MLDLYIFMFLFYKFIKLIIFFVSNRLNSYKQIFKKSSAFHPFLFVIFPIIFSYSNNMHEIKPFEVVFPLLIITSLVFLFWFGLRFLFKNKRKPALIISLLIVVFFSYGHVYLAVNDDSLIAVKNHRMSILQFLA